MIIVLADSLRYDFAIKYLKGIFPKESWSKFKAIETFTAPVLASIITGKTPEELHIPRDDSAFVTGIDPKYIDDTLFDYFDSYVTISRLIGNGPKLLPPSRRDNFKFLPPIRWNAVSNNDDDVLEYLGRKWSMVTNDWYDLIFYHCWLTHGPWGVDCYGPKEIPPMQNCDRWMERMRRMGDEGKRQLYNWYKLGVEDLASRLRAFHNISNGLETIIVFADHGEVLWEDAPSGHYSGGYDIEVLSTVPIWINREEQIPKDISHTKLKDWIVEMYEKYERNNEDYQKWKRKKLIKK